MKKLFCFVLLITTSFFIFAFDKNFDFTVLPKTDFTVENTKNGVKSGVISEDATAQKNKKDEKLPDQKLMRGFQRYQKVDAFGDPLPDSFLFYRRELPENQRSAYDEMYKAIMNFEDSVVLISRIKKSEFINVRDALWYDNPELFWWAGYSVYWYNSDENITKIEFNYLFSKEEMQKKYDLFLNMSFPIIFYAALLDNDIDKMKYIHDYLCQSIEYDWDSYNSGNYGGKLQSAYSAVCEYKTVCAGYSRAFAYYLQQLRIPCTVLWGSGHAWNLVTLDGSSYQIDVTWDDTNYQPPYFNLRHEQMQGVNSHGPSELSALVIRDNPSNSSKYCYKNYFGNIPIGKPYTYKEFKNIEEDIMNPIFAEIYTQK